MQIKRADAGRGANWLLDGFGYFRRSALAWIGVTILFFIISIVLSRVPLGTIALQVLTPAFVAGLLLGCKTQDEGGSLEVRHLFSGFSVSPGQLFLVGAVSVACTLVMLFVMLLSFVAVGVQISTLLEFSRTGQIMEITANPLALLLPVLIGLAVSVPLIMVLWFAPALIVLANLNAGQALKESFTACLINFVPLLVYGIVGFVLAILASIPLGLGWLILIPMIFASIYIAYKDIFSTALADQGV